MDRRCFGAGIVKNFRAYLGAVGESCRVLEKFQYLEEFEWPFVRNFTAKIHILAEFVKCASFRSQIPIIFEQLVAELRCLPACGPALEIRNSFSDLVAM